MKQKLRFTPDLLEKAKAMYASGIPPVHIDRDLGLPRGATRQRMWDERQKAARAGDKFPRHQAAAGRREPTEAELQDRNRRLSAPQTTTEFLMGDPRPGQSAGDKKGAG